VNEIRDVDVKLNTQKRKQNRWLKCGKLLFLTGAKQRRSGKAYLKIVTSPFVSFVFSSLSKKKT
jgi:hypothetical protein